MTIPPEHCNAFVVIGGGTAGLVVAARLSELPHLRVLILEAGESYTEDPRVKVPGLWHSMLGSEVDWNFKTVPQPRLGGRSTSISAGRMLGGTSALNTGICMPQAKAAVSFWAELGNSNWTWEVLEPYYKKFLHVQKPDSDSLQQLKLDWLDLSLDCPADIRRPIQASFTGDKNDELQGKWVETLDSLGYGLKGSPFSGTGVGAFHNPVTVDANTAERSYAATAYYECIKCRPNIHLRTGALVHNLILQAENNGVKAIGVRFSEHGEEKVVYPHKEVILAAGSLQSPKILELSGIGAQDLLAKNKIPLYVSNPFVGENLQDHPMTGISFEVREGINTMDDLLRQDSDAVKGAMEAYQSEGKGFFRFGGVDSYALMPAPTLLPSSNQETLSQVFDRTQPDAGSSSHPAARKFYDFARSVHEDPAQASASVFCTRVQHTYDGSSEAKDIISHLHLENYYSISAFLTYPLSRGSVHIASDNPLIDPVIDPKYFSQQIDQEIFARHLQQIEVIASTHPLVSLLKPNGKRNSANAHVKELAAAMKYLEKSVISGWHVTSTCSMLPRELGGVVNQNLIVYGTTNLRVVDASIMPLVPGGNPQTSVYAVAERASDIIKECYNI